jgi:ribosome-binding protein aMBF1 (putative translation factor)
MNITTIIKAEIETLNDLHLALLSADMETQDEKRKAYLKQVEKVDSLKMKYIGAQVTSARLAKGWSQQDLAEKIKTNVKYVRQVETGKRDIMGAGKTKLFEKTLGIKLKAYTEQDS